MFRKFDKMLMSAFDRMLGPGAYAADPMLACPDCGSDKVAMDAQTHGEDHWDVTIMCGDCHEMRGALLTNAQAVDLDLALAETDEAMLRALVALDMERWRDEAATFVVALQRDLIGADDFR